MTCTQCFQKIAPSTLEKSCKGEHRQQEGGEGEWEFPHGAKGVCVCGGALCFPLGSLKSPPLTLHTQPLRLTPGLAHFGGWGSPCSLCICGRGGSPQPRPWRPSSVPGGGAPEGGCLPSWAAHDLWIQQSLVGTCFLRLVFSLKTWSGGFSGASVYTAHPSGALWPISQHLWGSHRAPAVYSGSSPTPSLPHSPVASLLFIVLFFSSQVLGSRSFESQERCRGAFFNESNHQVLLEILFCFGTTYISWGKNFYLLCIASQCIQISIEMDEMVGREDSGLRSEDKTCLWIMM